MAKIQRKSDNAQNLTQDGIRKIQPPAAGRTYVYDQVQPGLSLCVTTAGSKTFYLAKRMGARFVRTPIGKAGELTVQQARDAVARMLGDHVVRGVDPVEEKREQRQQQARENVTLGDLWTHYLEHHARPLKRTWHEMEQQYKCHLSQWADRPLDDIAQVDVERLHRKIGKTAPYSANRVLGLLSSMFTKAASRIGYDGPNPCKGVEHYPEQKRERFLHGDEMPRFFAAVEQVRIRSDTTADALLMCLWTAARSGNVKSMRWQEVSLERGVWTIPSAKFKSNKSTTIPLVEQALEILRRRKETATSEWVFPSWRRPGKPIRHLDKQWIKLRDGAGLDGVRIHDLRRTAGSWMAAGGASLPIVGKALGHASTAATSIYARLDLSPVRAAISGAAAAMQAAGTAPVSRPPV